MVTNTVQDPIVNYLFLMEEETKPDNVALKRLLNWDVRKVGKVDGKGLLAIVIHMVVMTITANHPRARPADI